VKVPFAWILIALLAAPATAKRAPSTCGTYAERVREEIQSHRANVSARQTEELLRKLQGFSAGEAPPGANQDIGEIAVLEEDSGIVSRRNLFNLGGRTLRFRRAGTSYEVTNTAGGYDAEAQRSGAVVLNLGDDDSREFSLAFEFPYYGARFRSVFLNSDGNLSFEAGDGSTRERSLGRLLSGLPRIGAFFADLDPSRAGSVHVLSQPNRFVVTWLAVPEYTDFGIGPRNTLQLRLSADGTIEFSYEDVASNEAIVGIAPGRLSGGTSVVAYSTLTAPTIFPAAIAERFRATEEIDTVTVAQRFFETHDDAYDYLAIYNSLGIAPGPGVVAFEVTVRNNRTGYGDSVLDFGSEYGSPRRLQAVLNMGPLTQYPRDPNAILPTRATARDTPTTVLAHEAGHLFLAFASVPDPSNPTLPAMLGRQSAHWAFTFNSDASILEGNRILDRGPAASPRFETIAVTEQFAPLDQYLMGLRAKEEVGPLFYVGDSNLNTFFPPPPQIGRTFDGTRRDLTVDDLIAVHGRRTPDHTVSQRRYRFAIILITPRGAAPDPAAIQQVDAYRNSFQSFYNRATGERAAAETTLRKSLDLSLWPAAGGLVGRDFEAELRIASPAPTALNFSIRAPRGLVEAPAAVAIPAGAKSVRLRLRGLREGVEDFTITPADPSYMNADARIQVLAAPRNLRLQVIAGDGQTSDGAGFLPQPLLVQVSDNNRLPYPGLRIVATVAGNGAIEPASAVTREDGTASFRWRPASAPLNRVQFTLEGVPADELSVIAATRGLPFISGPAITNAASFAPGLTPQSLISIFGANLAAQASPAPFPWPTQWEGVTVRVNGRAQPIVFVSESQVNFYQADPLSGPSARVEIETSLGRSGEIAAPLRDPQPGVFFAPATGEAAAIRRGDFLEVYGTGFGDLAAGAPQAFWNGVPIPVRFAGLAPGFLGLNQINVELPANAQGANRLRLRVAGIDSNEVRVTLR
jgi:uncharacterized protein (TIGR03437 family)